LLQLQRLREWGAAHGTLRESSTPGTLHTLLLQVWTPPPPPPRAPAGSPSLPINLETRYGVEEGGWWKPIAKYIGTFRLYILGSQVHSGLKGMGRWGLGRGGVRWWVNDSGNVICKRNWNSEIDSFQ
jgi:hypothetical protein